MASKEYFYVRINPELASVPSDAEEAIQRTTPLTETELQKLMSDAAEDRSLMRDVERAIADRQKDAYALIDRVSAFGREFIGGGGEVIDAKERDALEAGKDAVTEGGTPLLVVVGKVGEEEAIHAATADAGGV